VRVNGDGTVTYTADKNTTATSDSFSYTIRSTSGQVSAPTAVSIALTGGGGGGHNAHGPVPTITTTAADTTNLASIPFTVTFDKDVTGFKLSDVRVSDGAVSGFTAVDARTYTFNVAPAIDGAVKVRLAAGVAKDTAGNESTAASKTLTSDRTAPTATIAAGASPAGQTTIPFTINFNEDVTGFTADKVVVAGGTVSGFTAVSARMYTFTVTPSGTGLVQVGLTAGSATDAAGNGNIATQFSTLPSRTDAGMLPTTSPPPDPNDPNWQTMANGLKIWDVQTGTGPAVTAGSTIGVFYTGWLLNGTVFDSNHTAGSPVAFPLSNLIQGWQQGIPGMQPGGIRRLYIPAALAYGSSGSGSVPPNSDLIFEIKLISVNA